MDRHERDLERAFDGQAERFERGPVQSDPRALLRLVELAALPQGARVLDAGCGPGLVAEAFLAAGYRVVGVDLSAEMVRRARERCARFGERASFEQGSFFALAPGERYDAAVSRYVLHHVEDPLRFIRALAECVGAGGVVVASDHTTDPAPAAARWHQQIERARDHTHTSNPTPGQMVDLFAAAGLQSIALAEERFELDFDEWFDRGTPSMPKADVRAMVLAGRARGFAPRLKAAGGICLECVRAIARGLKP
jgi:SAM-dependent methyltransferase